MSGKYALIIGNTEYIDLGLAQLTAPGKDAEDFARVLKDPNICAFDDVKVLANELSSTVIERIDEFFDQKKPDDMLVLYFSGHGVRDESGSLYLAFKNTIRSRLRSTAVKSDYIREAMDQSRSKRQVLILDCCNSGAFAQGTKAELGGLMGLTQAFQGYGRFVLTASDATQFAWEGDKVIGETQNSLFTHFLLKGLEGEADQDGDGNISVDELYDYAYEQVSKVTPNQTPTKSASKVAGDIVLRQITRIEDIKPVALPDELISEIEDTRPYVREAAVQKLDKILKGKNIGLQRSAKEALEKIISDENSTRRVAEAAKSALESIQSTEQKVSQKQIEDQESLTRTGQLRREQMEQAARFQTEKAELERRLKEAEERSVIRTTEETGRVIIPSKEQKGEASEQFSHKKSNRKYLFIATVAIVISLGLFAIANQIKGINLNISRITQTAEAESHARATDQQTKLEEDIRSATQTAEAVALTGTASLRGIWIGIYTDGKGINYNATFAIDYSLDASTFAGEIFLDPIEPKGAIFAGTFDGVKFSFQDDLKLCYWGTMQNNQMTGYVGIECYKDTANGVFQMTRQP